MWECVGGPCRRGGMAPGPGAPFHPKVLLGCYSWEEMGIYSAPSSHPGDWSPFRLWGPPTSLQPLPQTLAADPAASLVCTRLSGVVLSPTHLSPVPAGCPSPSSRVVCHVPVMGTATASPWSTMASRQPSTSPPVSLTSPSSRRLTLQLVSWAARKNEEGCWGRCSQTCHPSGSLGLITSSQCHQGR